MTNGILYEFCETPKMSTYLLTFVIGKFSSLSIAELKFPINLYYSSQNMLFPTPILKTIKNAFNFCQNYLKVPFPLPKCDLILVHELGFGASESWGAILGNENFIQNNFMYDELEVQIFGLKMICHEIIHKWFGNLVSIEYWSKLYMKEGFARYLEIKAMQKIFPEMNFEEWFCKETYSKAMKFDHSSNSHSLINEIKIEKNIVRNHDRISYDKAASLLRMLEFYMGSENFQKSLMRFLQKNQFGIGEANDLWEICAEISQNKKIPEIMFSWLQNKKYFFFHY